MLPSSVESVCESWSMSLFFFFMEEKEGKHSVKMHAKPVRSTPNVNIPVECSSHHSEAVVGHKSTALNTAKSIFQLVWKKDHAVRAMLI